MGELDYKNVDGKTYAIVDGKEYLVGNFHLEKIGPELAAEYLMRNRKNRDPKKVRHLRRDIKCGRWWLTHQAIAFDVDDELTDGQNRLYAICDTGATLPMWVYRGLPKGAVLSVDCGVARSGKDCGKIMGLDDPRYVQILRFMLRGMTQQGKKMSNQEEMLLVEEHEDALALGVRAFPEESKFCNYNIGAAVVARASFTVGDTERLLAFGKAMTFASAEQEDVSAAVFRAWYAETAPGKQGIDWVADVYRKTEWALFKFLAKDRTVKQQAHSLKGDELYPVPNANNMAEVVAYLEARDAREFKVIFTDEVGG